MSIHFSESLSRNHLVLQEDCLHCILELYTWTRLEFDAILLPLRSTHSVDIELFPRTARLRNSKLWMYPRVTTTQVPKHPREFPLFLQTPMLCWVKIFSLPVSVPPPQHLTYCVLSRKSVPNLRVHWEEEHIALHVPVFERWCQSVS